MQTIEISAEEAGRIKEFKVQEGQEVSEKTLLALIDDSQSQMAKKIAFYKLKAAEKDAAERRQRPLRQKRERDCRDRVPAGRNGHQRLYKGAVTELRDPPAVVQG